MGWNQGWEILEHQVIEIYNLDALTPPVIIAIGKVFAGTDIDFGGYGGILAKDGRDAEEIIIRTLGGEIVDPPGEPRPDWRDATAADKELMDRRDAWGEARSEELDRVTQEHFGW